MFQHVLIEIELPNVGIMRWFTNSCGIDIPERKLSSCLRSPLKKHKRRYWS
jgi:hypothetical protein